jgi:hypothetical protein
MLPTLESIPTGFELHRCMIVLCFTQQPQVGKRVSPAIDTATGTSSLHGRAADATTQHAWH